MTEAETDCLEATAFNTAHLHCIEKTGNVLQTLALAMDQVYILYCLSAHVCIQRAYGHWIVQRQLWNARERERERVSEREREERDLE